MNGCALAGSISPSYVLINSLKHLVLLNQGGPHESPLQLIPRHVASRKRGLVFCLGFGRGVFFYFCSNSKQSQAKGVSKVLQRVIPMVGDIIKVTDAPSNLVAICRDYIDAVNLCMNLSVIRRSRRQWATLLGMKEGSLSLILNKGGTSDRRRTLDPNLFEDIQENAGNRAISQFFDMQSRGLLNSQSKQNRIDQLEEELKQLKGQANA